MAQSPNPRIVNKSSIVSRQSSMDRREVYPDQMVPAHRVIPGVLAQVIRPAPLCAEKVDFAWRTSVGPAVSRATTVRLSDAGVLTITAQDAQWRREVERSFGLIRSRLEALLGPDVIQRVEIVCHG
jgi:hypothetical protein